MRTGLPIESKQLFTILVFLSVLAACGGPREETIAGVKVPIPSGMTKSEDRGMALSLPGFSGGQASFQGNVEPHRVVEFYKNEMPGRGWQPSVGFTSRGGMVSYSKEGQTLVVMVAKNDDGSSMTLMVGSAR